MPASGERRRRKLQKNVLRTFETLEERQLLTVAPWSDGLYYPPIGLDTGFMTDYERYAQISAQQYGGNSGGGNSGGGEGLGFTSITELESNDQLSSAQLINLGLGPSKNDGVGIGGSLIQTVGRGGPIADVDYFAMDLKAGDFIDVRAESILGAVLDVSIYDSQLRELVGANTPAGNTYPVSSPLSTDGNTSFSFVAHQDGRYYARISEDLLSLPILNYNMTLRAYRGALESEPIGTVQTVFLDFDGAIIPRSIFGAPGTARLSPLADFLPGWGLQPEDESRVIDKIINVFASKFYGATAVNSTGGNGDYFSTGKPGDFGLRILNSRDHADPFGQEHVSRIIIGGTVTEFGIGTIGLAQSVDTGNFDGQESAVTLLDQIFPLWGPIPRAGNIPLEDVLADAIGSVSAHEAGHFFGAWHTLNSNVRDQIMDTGGNLTGLIGVGLDGVYGTPDDVDVQFGTDDFDPIAGSFQFGKQHSAEMMAFGLATGKAGGATINGRTFNDRNVNRIFDSADVGLAGVRVYTDVNNNRVYDVGESFVFSGADGTYSLIVAPGTYSIRQEVPTGARQTTVPEAISVSLVAGRVVNGINFGNEFINQGFTGVKFNDLDGDGLKDGNEPTIAGVWVYIDLDGDNRIDIGEPADQTDENGRYTVSFPGPGTYAVREVIPPGFVQTLPGESNDGDPSNDFEYTVVVTGNPAVDAPNISGLDFGNRLTVDFGDAPQTYGTASHGFVDGLILGALWDAEPGSLFSPAATGDDNNNLDDEDGVILGRPLVAGSNNNRVEVTAINSTGAPGYLHGWIDFNHNGSFSADEKVISNEALGTGTTSVTFSAPANAVLGSTVARFRYSGERDLLASGASSSGEVEDYVFSVVDTLQLANDDQYTISRNSVLNDLDVLANDFSLPGETLTIINTSASQAGATLQINPAGSILYTPPSAFLGQDVFTYTVRNSGGDVDSATVVVDVRLFFENPMAIDDSFDLATNAVDFPINVLANDIEGQNGALTIISATQPDKGGRITIATGGKSLRYTPARSFGGTEFFTYTVADAGGNRSTAQVTLHTLPGDRADDDVAIQLIATDLSGAQITAIEQGQDFLIRVVVDDLRFDAANPGTAAGVFSAYADLLYNRQLVSTAAPSNPQSPLNFDVTFFNDYFNFQNGDASVPGIINEFGAFNVRQVMNDPNPLVLAAIRFTAGSPGIASFMPDPADAAPPNDTLLFDTPGSAVPDERIRYLGTSIEIVGDGVEFPVAVDDSVPGSIPVGSIAFPINVLANDRPGSTGQISLVSATNGVSGITAIDTRGTANPLDDRVLYTPSGGFNGADQFTYTIQDTRGIQSTATVTLRVGNADADDIVGLRLSATDLSGNPIDSIEVGGQFQLRGFVQDLRGFGTQRGIFAAYEDVLYSSTLVSPVPSTTNDPNLGFQVAFGPNYQEVFSGDIRTPGVINEIGAVQSRDNAGPLGSAEQLLFIVTMTANALGTANFIGDPADISPLHDTLTFEPPAAVGFGQIRYGFDTLNIIGSGGGGGGEGYYHNSQNMYDVNNDGFISPIDALGVINLLNGGSRTNGGGEGESGSQLFVDVNADGSLSPLDALLVINRLNGGGSGEGEGEIASLLGAGTLAESAQGVVSDEAISGEQVTENAGQRKDGVRLTNTSNGPNRNDLYAGLGEDEGSSESMDDLLEQIAPDIGETWKKRFSL